MTIKIDRKIIKYQVQKPEDKPQDKPADKASEARAAPAKAASEARIAAEARVAQPGETELVRDKNGHTAKVIRMHEKLERPEVLVGSTYKIKTPISDHAMYVTINDIVLNEGTEFEQRRPFEIFINSKNLDHFQWIVALTRIISAVKEGRRRHLSGGRAQGGVRSARRLLAAGRQVHALDHRRARPRHREAPADHRPVAQARARCASAEAGRPEARRVRRAREANRRLCEVALPCRSADLRPLQHRGGRHAGRLHDLPELR